MQQRVVLVCVSVVLFAFMRIPSTSASIILQQTTIKPWLSTIHNHNNNQRRIFGRTSFNPWRSSWSTTQVLMSSSNSHQFFSSEASPNKSHEKRTVARTAKSIHNQKRPESRTITRAERNDREMRPISQTNKAVMSLASLKSKSIVSSSSTVSEEEEEEMFRPGDKVLVEIMSFGPLGATVHVVAHHSHNPKDIREEDEPIATGLILQKEIRYFREGRGNIDVLTGEILPGYVERIRFPENNENQQNNNDDDDDDDIQMNDLLGRKKKNSSSFVVLPKLDIGLREFGGKAKTDTASVLILERLKKNQGTLPLGDKTPPEIIAREFPGLSKKNFKRAISALYKQGKIIPGPESTSLVR